MLCMILRCTFAPKTLRLRSRYLYFGFVSIGHFNRFTIHGWIPEGRTILIMNPQSHDYDCSPSASYSAGPSSFQIPTYHPSDPTAGPSCITLNSPTYAGTSPGVSEDTISAAPRPSFGPGSRGSRARGRARGSSSTRGFGRARGTSRGRGGGGGGGGGGRGGSSARASTRLSARAEQASKVRTLKLSFKTGPGDTSSRKSSFLGEYDRELDENPEEPLVFEEQFILRVPREVSEGGNGLREIVKGKGRGVEGVEFKFLGGLKDTG